MLSRLAFKLSVEMQYKDGVEKLIRLYQVENDRKSGAEAEIQRIECRQKVQLLMRAFRRYEDLYVGAQNSKDEADYGSVDMASQRKPITGQVFIEIHEITKVESSVFGHSVREPVKSVLMKVDHTVKIKTKTTKTDRWMVNSTNLTSKKPMRSNSQCMEDTAPDNICWLAWHGLDCQILSTKPAKRKWNSSLIRRVGQLRRTRRHIVRSNHLAARMLRDH